MEEIWKDIKGYEGLYQVSNLGRVKRLVSIKCKKERFIAITKSKKDGYCRIMLCKNDVCRRFLFHRLLAEHFIPNPELKPCIDHVNGDRSDNRLENLRWCTHKENNNFPIARKNNSDAQKKLRTNLEWVNRNNEAVSEAMKRPEVRSKLSIAAKKSWKNPDYIKKQMKNRPKKGVCKYDMNGLFVSEYISIIEAQRDTGIDSSSIVKCCKGKSIYAGGFKWKYKSDVICQD